MHYAKNQLALPLSRAERLALIDGVDPERAGLSVRSWRTCRDMLKQIEFCSTGDESGVRIETLAARLAVNRSTIVRTADKLEASGMLQITRDQYNRQGKAPNGWRIRWDRLIAVQERGGAHVGDGASKDHAGGMAGRGAAFGGEAHNAPHRVQDAPHRVQDAPHPIRGIKFLESSIRSTVDAIDEKKAADHEDESVQGLAVRRLADRLVAKVGACRSRGDWELAVKACVVSERLGERWLWHAAEGVALIRPKKPWAYLHRTLAESCRGHGLSFNRLLTATELPPAAATWRGGDAWSQQQRSCIAESEPS